MQDLELLTFDVDGIQCALPITNVLRVESAVAVSPLPNAPEMVTGLVKVRGKLLPVLDVRPRLNLPVREMVLEDHLILVKTVRRELALWVGSVRGVECCPQVAQNDVHPVLEKLPHLLGVTTLRDDLVLIYDLEKFLSDEEDLQLTRALETVNS